MVERKNPFKQVKYLNLGLVKGVKRSGGIIGLNDHSSHENIGARYRDMLQLLDPTMHEQAHKLFIEFHKEYLEKARVPWVILISG